MVNMEEGRLDYALHDRCQLVEKPRCLARVKGWTGFLNNGDSCIHTCRRTHPNVPYPKHINSPISVDREVMEIKGIYFRGALAFQESRRVRQRLLVDPLCTRTLLFQISILVVQHPSRTGKEYISVCRWG